MDRSLHPGASGKAIPQRSASEVKVDPQVTHGDERTLHKPLEQSDRVIRAVVQPGPLGGIRLNRCPAPCRIAERTDSPAAGAPDRAANPVSGKASRLRQLDREPTSISRGCTDLPDAQTVLSLGLARKRVLRT